MVKRVRINRVVINVNVSTGIFIIVDVSDGKPRQIMLAAIMVAARIMVMMTGCWKTVQLVWMLTSVNWESMCV